MATHSSVLAWRIPGTGEPGGLPSMGSHRVRHSWSDLAAAASRGLFPWLTDALAVSFHGLSSVCQISSSYKDWFRVTQVPHFNLMTSLEALPPSLVPF